MINLPSDILDPLFDSKFQRGAVIKTLFKFSDGRKKYKYIIILNHDCSQDPVLCFLTTSQIDFYNKNPQFNRDAIRIKPSQGSLFEQETIINCRELHRVTKDILKKNFKNNVLEFVGQLPDDLMGEINRIVKESYFISKQDQNLILGTA